jgi:capsular exopolysaccharide synthesis family protein
MSHIFEALQRAEAERSGGTHTKVSDSAADLLERALALQTEQMDPAVTPGRREGDYPLNLESLATSLAVVPTPASDARLVCLTDQGSLAAEKFRVLGLRLRNLREKRQLKRIVVTSTIPEEGKTLSAANLALNQARSKVLRTLLVDGDLRRPALASRFGLSRSMPGLAECLSGERQLSDVICKVQGTNLWFLPAGEPPENPLELMQSGRTADLLNTLGSFFDWIIIDSPPLFPLADASFWARLSDGVLLVVREGVTEKKPLQKVSETLDRSLILGVIVNSCSDGNHKNYYQRYKARSASRGEAVSAENE